MVERQAREEARAIREPPEPRSPTSAANMKKKILEEKLANKEQPVSVESGFLPLPDDEIDVPFGISDMAKHGHRYIGDIGDDKIVAEYDIYMNAPTKKLLIIQYPNRDPGQPYSNKTGQKPLEIRIKPKCGLVEVDIPMDIHTNFDKEKGIIYGEAMRKSHVLQEGGSYGMAGGLGIGSKPRSTATGSQTFTTEEPSHESLLANFDDANNKGHVMNKITLGGTIVPFKSGNDPNYYIGVFKGGE